MKGNFVTNDNRMRAYRTAATNILNAFSEFNLAKISRSHNIHAHSLATFASTCKLPFDPNHHFTVEIKHRPTIPIFSCRQRFGTCDMTWKISLHLQKEEKMLGKVDWVGSF